MTVCEACQSPLYPSPSALDGIKRPRIGSPAEAYQALRFIGRLRCERLVIIALDSQNVPRWRRPRTVSVGTLNTTRTHPREIFQPLIKAGALAFVMAHNHPSGSLDVSRDDIDFTATIIRAAELMGIALYDHLVVTRSGYVSLRERGLM